MVVQTEEMQTSPKYCYQENDKGDLNGFKSNFVSIKYLSQSDTGQLENAKEKKCMDTFEKPKKIVLVWHINSSSMTFTTTFC